MSMKNNTLDYEALCNCAGALMCALKHKDIYTQLHSERIVALSEKIGRACKLEETEISMLKVSACFHDIGKIGISDEILLKQAKLNPEEWVLMKTHSEKGEDIVNKLEMSNCSVIAGAVRHHHEYFNGSGYPDQLSGEKIPILSRIISVADSYDAMTQTRPYHKSIPHQQTMEILFEEKGYKSDPYVANKFEAIIKNSSYKAE